MNCIIALGVMSRHSRDEQFINEQTSTMRTSQDPLVAGIRRCLLDKGVQVATAAIAEWFPDDTSFEFGVVVTVDGRVFQFGYDYLGKPEDEGSISEWEDLTASWKSCPYAQTIEVAMTINSSEHED